MNSTNPKNTASNAEAENNSQSHSLRQEWMSILARADFETLQIKWSELTQSLDIKTNYQILRPAEIGMVMVRASVNGSGSPFNMGEATATRCSVQMNSGEMGSAYILGRNKPHAELAAVIDAVIQNGEFSEHILKKLLQPLAELEVLRQKQRQRKAATTKVDFFTLTRGED